jgi:RecJ-like exonuclease
MTQTSDIYVTAKSIANLIQTRDFDKVQIITHIDADGLTAAGIAALALGREEIVYDIKFVKQLDDPVISDLNDLLDSSNGSKILFWFTDLGSGMNRQINHLNPIITDHHAPSFLDYDIPVSARTDLLAFGDVLEDQKEEFHLNPHLYNLDGTYDVSGAGTVYLVARELNKNNIDLAHLAIIGAVGDLQNSRYHKLVGTNQRILDDAKKAEKLEVKIDISSFGRETRPIQNVLMYSTDPYLPGLTMNEINCINFLTRLEIPLKASGRQRHWVDLTLDERKSILSELMELLLSKGIGHRDAKRLLGEVYILTAETSGTPLHDAKEFATLLNSCGKYNRPEVGFQICLGDRSGQLNSALDLLKGHKSVLMEGMQYIKDLGIKDFGEVQYFNARNKIPDNIVGTIASMILSNNDVNQNKTIFGFAITEDGKNLKVSGRATRELVERGLNLSTILRTTCEILGNGSVGGGHDIAAGGTIPLDKEQEFLEHAERLIREQLK